MKARKSQLSARATNSTLQRGRPTKYTADTVDRLIQGITAGLTNRAACRAAGISEDTLANWKGQYPELGDTLEAARESSRETALREIQAAGEKDWRANVEWLRLTSPEHRPGHAGVLAALHIQNSVSGIVVSQQDLEDIRSLRQSAGYTEV